MLQSRGAGFIWHRLNLKFDKNMCLDQGWKPKLKPKPENPVLKEILETQTETDTYLAKFLKT